MSKSDFDTGTPCKREREESESPVTPTNPPRKKSTMAPTPKPDESFAAAFKALNDNLNAMRADFTSKFDELSGKIDNEFITWQREKAEIITKQTELESRLDRMERNEKRCNIVISGLNITGAATAKSAVDELFTKQLGLAVTANDAFQIKLKSGQTKFIARMRSWDDKMMVMKANRAIRNDVFLNDDLIKKDQFVQYKAREFAKSMRADGKQAKIGAVKVFVDGMAFIWDETQQQFINRKN